MASENWLKEHEALEREIQAITQQFSERSKFPKSSTNYSRITVSTRATINKLNGKVTSLSRRLDDVAAYNTITSLEKNRRINMLNQLLIALRNHEESLRDELTNQKGDLIDFGGGGGGGAKSSNQYVDDELIGFSSSQLLTQQERIISEQDAGIENLSKIINNQKLIATSIGQEVDRQNEMIDTMDDKMVRIQTRIEKSTKRVRFIDRKSSTCGMWILIVFLLVVIIVIASLPGR